MVDEKEIATQKVSCSNKNPVLLPHAVCKKFKLYQ
jgi:hypothetical protein